MLPKADFRLCTYMNMHTYHFMHRHAHSRQKCVLLWHLKVSGTNYTLSHSQYFEGALSLLLLLKQLSACTPKKEPSFIHSLIHSFISFPGLNAMDRLCRALTAQLGRSCLWKRKTLEP